MTWLYIKFIESKIVVFGMVAPCEVVLEAVAVQTSPDVS